MADSVLVQRQRRANMSHRGGSGDQSSQCSFPATCLPRSLVRVGKRVSAREQVAEVAGRNACKLGLFAPAAAKGITVTLFVHGNNSCAVTIIAVHFRFGLCLPPRVVLQPLLPQLTDHSR